MTRKPDTQERQYNDDDLVDSYGAARVMGLSPRTIRDMATKRLIPLYKLGPRTTRFKLRDIKNWAESKRIDLSKSINGERNK